MADKEWTTEQRKAAPRETFCGPHNSFPVETCSDVSHARSLLHNAKGNQGSISSCIEGKSKSLSCSSSSDTGKSKNAMTNPNDYVGFGAALQPAGITTADGMVVRRGKIFQVGDYPDKQFSLSPEEAVIAVGDFAPVPLSFGHPGAPSQIDGKLGELRKLEYLEGGDIAGEAVIPAWLDELIGADGFQVSAEWNRGDKHLTGLSFVTDPRVSGAALMAAFAASHDTPSGQFTMQQHHDNAARAGAVCKKPTANMASKHEADANQQIHDLAAAHGAQCDGSKQGMSGARPAMYAKEQKSMSFKDKVVAWFAMGQPDEFEEPATPYVLPENSRAASVATLTVSPDTARFAALEQRLAVEMAKRISSEAVAFADTEVREKRSMPADRERLIAKYERAAQDDEALGVVTFADGKTSTRVQALIEDESSRTPHMLDVEMLPVGTDPAVFANQMTTARAGAEKPMTPERRAELYGMSDLGREILASQNGHRN